jgi:hypothetical protein
MEPHEHLAKTLKFVDEAIGLAPAPAPNGMDTAAMEATIGLADSSQRTDTITVEQLCEEIATRRRAKYAELTKPYARSNPIASDISDCARETALAITYWKERPEFPVEVVERMARGNQIENWIIQELTGPPLNYTVRVERQPFELRDKKGRLVNRGRIDGFLSIGRKDFAFEGKSMTPNMFDRIDSQEDFDRYLFFRKYPRQLQAYLIANNLEEGFWVLDDCMGHWKLIPCRLDYDRAEKVLKQCETAVEHLANDTLPPFHSDPQTCLKCWAFKRVCIPPFFATGEGMQVIDDPELAAKIRRRAELADAANEYNRLDKQLKTVLKEAMKPDQIFLIGDFMVTATEHSKKAYSVAASTYKTFEIEPLEQPRIDVE